MKRAVAPGALVTLELDLLDEEGELLETDLESPLRYVHGAGELLPALEEALAGARAGDEISVTLPPEEAFGEHDPEGLFLVSRGLLPDDVEIAPGNSITIVVRDDEGDDDQDGGEIEARIVEVEGEGVVLDANHPLAGLTLTVRARVLAVEAPSP